MARRNRRHWTEAEKAELEPEFHLHMHRPVTGPFHVTRKDVALAALENAARTLNLYNNRAPLAPCRLLLWVNYTPAELAIAPAAVAAQMQASAAYYLALFPIQIYPDAWRRNPHNAVLMEVLGTTVIGDFPRLNALETDQAYFLRASLLGRIFQQVFPLPPKFQALAAINNENLAHVAHLAMLVAIWTWNKMNGVSQCITSNGFPIKQKNFLQAQVPMNMTVLLTLAEKSYAGFGSQPVITANLVNLQQLLTSRVTGAWGRLAYNHIIQFIRYILNEYEFDPNTGYQIATQSFINAGNLYMMRHRVFEKGRQIYSDNRIANVTQIQEIAGGIHYSQIPIRGQDQYIKQAMFFHNFILFDTLVYDFKDYFSNAGILEERCLFRCRHITQRENARIFPLPPQPPRWCVIHQNLLTTITFHSTMARNERDVHAIGRRVAY